VTKDPTEAIERQRIPPDAADIAKGYFENDVSPSP